LGEPLHGSPDAIGFELSEAAKVREEFIDFLELRGSVRA
jgi:hypothetical protein